MKWWIKFGLTRDDVAEKLGIPLGMPDFHQRISDLKRWKLIEVFKLKGEKCHWPLRSGHPGECLVITKQGLRAYTWATDLSGPGGVRRSDPETSHWAAIEDRASARFAVLQVFVQFTRPL